MPLCDRRRDMPVVRIPGDVKVFVVPQDLTDGLLFDAFLEPAEVEIADAGACCQSGSSSLASIRMGDAAR